MGILYPYYNKYKQRYEKMNRNPLYKDKRVHDIAKFIIIILIVLILGLIAVNQTLEYFYRSKFLQSPCSLCKELNQEKQIPYIYNISNNQIINFTEPG